VKRGSIVDDAEKLKKPREWSWVIIPLGTILVVVLLGGFLITSFLHWADDLARIDQEPRGKPATAIFKPGH
jgi:hypothetical protein